MPTTASDPVLPSPRVECRGRPAPRFRPPWRRLRTSPAEGAAGAAVLAEDPGARAAGAGEIALQAGQTARPDWRRHASRLLYRLAMWAMRRRFLVRERVFRCGDGMTIAYDECGSRRKPTVILAPGFASSKDYYLLVARSLRRGYHVIVPDLPGFGRSGRLEEANYTLKQYGSWMAEFLRSIRTDQLHYLGNSFGGAIGLDLALNYGDFLRSLILVSTGGVKPEREPSVYDEIEAGHNPFALERVDEYELFLSRLMHRPVAGRPIFRAHLAAQFVEDAPWFARLMRDLTGQGAARSPGGKGTDLGRCAYNEQLRKLRQPTLIIWGEADRFLPSEIGRLCAREIPHADLQILRGVGHCPQIEAPGQVVALCRSFLDVQVAANAG